MVVAILNGTLSEVEQDAYIRQATELYPISIIEKLILDVQDGQINVRYQLHHFRDLRKMGGCCIGDPSGWNYAKQAELRDTIPNWID